MVFEINGVNVLPFIAQKGIKWQRNDLDGENAGRTMDGIMHRSRVATKIRLDVTCLPMRSEDAITLLNLIYPEYVQVKYTDPMYGLVEKTMYSNNTPATHMCIHSDGVEYWEGVTFPLIER